MDLRRVYTAVALSLFLLFSFVFAGVTVADDAIIIVTNGDARFINPIFVIDADGYWRTDFLFDAIISFDPDTHEPVPHLARDWDISEDGRTYTFYLNEEATWHDGEPVTAHDLEFTIHAILNPQYASPFQGEFEILKGAEDVIAGTTEDLPGVRVLDDYTIELVLERRHAPFMAVVLRHFKPLPKHLLAGKELSPDMDYSHAPVGNGPYIFHRWERGEEFVMVANEDYWAGPPKNDRIIQRVVPDMAAIAMTMEAGDADVTVTPPPGEVPRLAELPHLVSHILPPGSNEGIRFNLEHPILSDPMIRRAIAHAINIEPFTEVMLMGIAEPAKSHMATGSWAYNPEARLPEYDPEKAKELLAEAGYPQGFEINLSTNAGNVFREQLATYIQAELSKIGIRVNVEFIEWGTFIAGVREGDFEMAIHNAYIGVGEPDIISDEYYTGGRANHMRYSNLELDRLLDEARKEVDLEKRTALYYRAQEILVEDMPIAPMFGRPNPYIMHVKIQGFYPSSIPPHFGKWNVHQWEIDPDWDK